MVETQAPSPLIFWPPSLCPFARSCIWRHHRWSPIPSGHHPIAHPVPLKKMGAPFVTHTEVRLCQRVASTLPFRGPAGVGSAGVWSTRGCAPVPRKMMGLFVAATALNAPPPLAWPSILVRITPPTWTTAGNAHVRHWGHEATQRWCHKITQQWGSNPAVRQMTPQSNPAVGQRRWGDKATRPRQVREHPASVPGAAQLLDRVGR